VSERAAGARTIIDAWAQHPTLRHMNDPMFESLRRWTKGSIPTTEIPLAATIEAMDRGGVGRALLSAWLGPHRGRMDCTATGSLDVARHVRTDAEFVAGLYRPAWMTDGQWELCCSRHELKRDEARSFLDTYQIGD
jgi:hypothetical protein